MINYQAIELTEGNPNEARISLIIAPMDNYMIDRVE